MNGTHGHVVTLHEVYQVPGCRGCSGYSNVHKEPEPSPELRAYVAAYVAWRTAVNARRLGEDEYEQVKSTRADWVRATFQTA